MPRVVSAKEFLDLSFPLKGNDASNEFWRQADLTTVLGVNVRGEEPVGQNMRGGQRAGVSRFIDDLVAGPGDVIQMLNVVVDPQARGLNADTGEQIPGYIPDPSTNNLSDRGSTNRFVPPGGSGRPPNRNIPGSAAGIALRQSKLGGVGGDTGLTVSFDVPPLVGSVLVAFVITANQDTGSVPSSILLNSVRNAALLDYANVGGTGYYAEVRSSPVPGPSDLASKYAASMWWLKSVSGSDQDVVIDAGGTAFFSVGIMEFTGSTATSARDAFNRWTVTDIPQVEPETTHIGVEPTAGSVSEFVVACFGGQMSDPTPTSKNGYVLAAGDGYNAGQVTLLYKTGVSPSLVPVPELTMTTSGGTGLVSQFGISATFKST